MMAASVLLTGTSSGLDEALFDAYLQAGARVVALARRYTATQRQWAGHAPDRVALRPVELADRRTLPDAAALRALIAADEPGGKVSLVHNAATVEPLGLIGALDADTLVRAVQVNVTAPLLLTNAFLAEVPTHVTTVQVVYVTSSAAGDPYPGWATYCATKAAAELFVRCAEVSTRPACTVQVVDPGGMDTPMHARLRTRGDGLPGHDRLLRRHADGLLADPVDVARAIVAQTLPAPSVRPVSG